MQVCLEVARVVVALGEENVEERFAGEAGGVDAGHGGHVGQATLTEGVELGGGHGPKAGEEGVRVWARREGAS